MLHQNNKSNSKIINVNKCTFVTFKIGKIWDNMAVTFGTFRHCRRRVVWLADSVKANEHARSPRGMQLTEAGDISKQQPGFLGRGRGGLPFKEITCIVHRPPKPCNLLNHIKKTPCLFYKVLLWGEKPDKCQEN
jgi:hypothetical protein